MATTNRSCLSRSRLSRRHAIRLSLVMGGLAILSGCGGANESSDDANDELLAWPADDRWPAQLRRAAPEVQDAYRYVVANPDVMQYMPCFCGCASQGHRSNLDCYVREFRDDGSVLLDPMSFG